MDHDTSQEGWVVVSGAATGFAQDVTAGGHRLTSDEPLAAGGTAHGPSPYDLLLAALGSCTSMTLGMYARRKQWPLDQVIVRLRHTRSHAQDCAACESAPARLTRIDREIELRGALDGEQRARLLQIANKCPVHQTLTGKIDVETTMK
jgi:putative redox protein